MLDDSSSIILALDWPRPAWTRHDTDYPTMRAPLSAHRTLCNQDTISDVVATTGEQMYLRELSHETWERIWVPQERRVTGHQWSPTPFTMLSRHVFALPTLPDVKIYKESHRSFCYNTEIKVPLAIPAGCGNFFLDGTPSLGPLRQQGWTTRFLAYELYFTTYWNNWNKPNLKKLSKKNIQTSLPYYASSRDYFRAWELCTIWLNCVRRWSMTSKSSDITARLSVSQVIIQCPQEEIIHNNYQSLPAVVIYIGSSIDCGTFESGSSSESIYYM